MYEKAVAYFERAAQIQPQEVKWKLMVASCHRRSGDYQLAFEIYRLIHADFPDNVECLRYLVHICDDLGKKDQVRVRLRLRVRVRVRANPNPNPNPNPTPNRNPTPTPNPNPNPNPNQASRPTPSSLTRYSTSSSRAYPPPPGTSPPSP